MHVGKGMRSAALVSRHGPTCRRVAQSLGGAGVWWRPPQFPSELPVGGGGDATALLVALVVARGAARAGLGSEALRGYPAVPLRAAAGVDARTRLLDALCEADVNHVIPKRGAL